MPPPPLRSTGAFVPEPLPLLIEQYLQSLQVENASPHTLRNYRIELEQFAAYFTPKDGEPPEVTRFDVLAMREWMGSLYDRELQPVSIRRKLAAVRSFFKYLQRHGILERNVAKLVRTPKMPKTLPAVMTPEHTSNLLEGMPAEARRLERPHPERDVAILELLYGTGVRVSELVGINVEDVNLPERWLRVRGKGKKEREVPIAGKAAVALEAYLPHRSPAVGEVAVFLNDRGKRLTDRSVRSLVKLYSKGILKDSSLHPHSFRHAYATHLLSDGADLRSIQELLGHAQLSTTQKYTQVALSDLMRVYDDAHPRAKVKLPGPG